QSGPLLVRSNQIHSQFKPDSEFRLVRNGVGVPSPDQVIFAISVDPLNLYEFAAFFRDILHCPDALYFDGTVSSLYAPELRRSDKIIDLGPVIGITTTQ
ncbi:MAG: phosphodiester glycosidase family protein, partial [Verrucomicrobiota bacterium]